MEPILISIAVCTYDGEKYIVEQLDSLAGQDYPNLEIVIVDDCSNDNTYALLEQYQQKHNNNIRLYKNTENLGFNKNFERALSLCLGNYIAIADQDDIWDLQKISLMMKNKKDNLLLYHDSAIMNNDGSLTGKMSDGHRFVSGQCEEYLLYNNSVSGHTCFINKELLPHIIPFPPNMYYDWWMSYTAACLGRIDFIDASLVKHRRHTSNSTVADKVNDKDRRINNLKLFENHPLNRPSTTIFIKQLLSGYEVLDARKFSFKLFFVLLLHHKTLFYTRKKSLFTKAKFIFKECWGKN